MICPHLIRIEENSSTEVEIQLSDRDRRLLSQFKPGPNGDLVIEELKNSVRIRAFSSVGSVRFDTFEIQIHPKIAKEHIRVIQMIGLTRGVDLLRRFKQHPTLNTNDYSLFDLIILLLVEEAEQLIRNGLLASYREEEDLLPMMRGRLLVDRQMLDRFGVLDRVHCRFDELTMDIAENQLLATALSSCTSLASSQLLRNRVQRVLGDLQLHCSQLDVAMHQPMPIYYDRLNQHYRVAHELCWLVLSRTGIKDFYANGQTKCFSFLINMSKLFEEFIEAILRKLFNRDGCKVIRQCHSPSVIRDALTGETYSSVIPDVRLFQSDGTGYCIDAKYKLYDQSKISNADIYQLFLYAFAYASEISQRRSVLIFPSETNEPIKHQLSIRCGDGSVGWVTGIGVHIPTVIDEIESNSYSSIKQSILEALLSA